MTFPDVDRPAEVDNIDIDPLTDCSESFVPESYGLACGFDVRLATDQKSDDGIIIWKYLLCNREGKKNVANVDVDDEEISKIKRRRISRRFSCMTRMVLRYSASVGYVVTKFISDHTHPLVPDAYRHFMKMNRNLDLGHKQFILNCARANIGPVKSYRLFKETVGAYSKVGCSVSDFKNFSRDLHAYALGKDAQMILDKFHRRRELCSAFSFEYCVDENEKLTRIFWADPISRRNFHVFGEVVAFDATYKLNRYNMIFAPFTGKDNHGKCVTFGAALLSSEDVESYSWLFETFVACMGKTPTMIITDQDPAMKIAVQRSLTGTKHRLCMWHIMKKVNEKFPTLKDDATFTQALKANVWSEMIEPSEFENNWNELMNSFGLSGSNWFGSMYEIRHSWVPAYFRDFPMSGLLKTTSIAECENSFFGRYAEKHANLLEFVMHFDSAIDTQRHTYERLSSEDQSCFPEMKSELLIEKHAASVFTASKFIELQNEILKACYKCSIRSITVGESKTEFDVDGFSILFDRINNSVICSCKKFVRMGLVCSHMFVVFKNLRIERIPEQYIVSRWTKNACAIPLQEIPTDIVYDASRVDRNKISMNNIYSAVYKIIGMVDTNADKTDAFLRCLLNFKDGLDNEEVVRRCSNKDQLFEDFYGSSVPSDVSVLPPDQVKTKGSGSRLISRRDKAIQVMKKPLRKCGKCKQMARHDLRNCGKQKDK